ncbi:DUF2199 domain-containing protein [Granulicella sp. 5B5]|uniref:DUF2199 domain-containing protein n=1 Tax=Granulicella sp. 5B5 TaxID=1617967 RepID=UPI0015F6AB9C|nr:DUF2199 domain-containing protein [Granulicella sp. 5B5]
MAGDVAGEFLCSICGERHALSLSYSVKAPKPAGEVSAAEQAARVEMTKDQCVIDGSKFYLRGRIPIPVHGLEEPFIWGVWAEVSPKTYLRADAMWKVEGRENEPVFTGYLATEMPVYGNTIDLEVDVQTQRVGRRPHFFVQDPLHPIAVEQREGISLGRVQEIAEMVLHPGRP